MILRPEAELQGRTARELLETLVTSVPVPQVRAGV
jgi:MoxR-like ATPase